MKWSLSLLALCAAVCVIQGQSSAPRSTNSPLYEDTQKLVNSFLKSIGYQSCVDANCGHETSDTTGTKLPGDLNTRIPAVDDDYEQQDPDPEHTREHNSKPSIPTDDTSEAVSNGCLNLTKAVKEFEQKHPDIADVKCDVLYELIRTTTLYAVKDRIKCNPVVKFLDLIMLAADKLKSVNVVSNESNCEYEYRVEATEIPVHSSTKYGKTLEASSYHEVATPKPTSENPTRDTQKARPNGCQKLTKAVKEFEQKYPDIADVKCDVLDELVRITSLYAVKDKCNPVVKLLDLIILAADKLKSVNVEGNENNCEYEYHEETNEIPESSSTEYIETSSYHEAATTKPTPECSPSEATPYVETAKAEVTSPVYEQKTKVYEQPCPEKQCEDRMPTEEVIAEDYEEPDHIYPPFVGSIRGIPGEHYPNYSEVPITSFSCADKYIPGFYADLETGCQVFHVCYKHRRESFLCPLGTIFNQPILACDYWYSSNCSLAPVYYEVNAKPGETLEPEEMDTVIGDLIENIIEGKQESTKSYEESKLSEHALDDLVKFLPVKAKITVFPKTEISQTEIVSFEEPVHVSEVASETFDIASTETDVVHKIPEPVEVKETKKQDSYKPKFIAYDFVPTMPMKAVPVASKEKVIPIVAKAKLAAAVPVAKVMTAKTAKAKLAVVPVAKVLAAKAAVPILAKAKLAAAVPIKVLAAKSVAKAKMAAVPIAKAIAVKAAVPILAKAKVAAAIPVAKIFAAKAAVPVLAKAKIAAAVPIAKAISAKIAVPILVKAKAAATVPIAKAIAVKAAVPILAKAKVAAAVPVAKVFAAKAAVPVVAKAKLAAVPVAAKFKLLASKAVPAAKIATFKVAIPVAAKTKLAVAIPSAKVIAAKSAVPAKVIAKKAVVPIVVKGKIAATIPVAKAAAIKVAVPALKAKILGASIPFAKSVVMKSAIPVKAKIVAPALKAKIFKTAAVPIAKGKLMALSKSKFAAPVFIKAKLAKAAAISPLTKKALVLGYMKLLKAKKLALMG